PRYCEKRDRDLEMADNSILYDDRTSLPFKLADIYYCEVK
ncbi:MAG: hypothetical protein RLZZ424_1202, partial [Bacteroidota bacterium]